MAEISLILARSANNGIGFQNKLPWHLPQDLKLFKEITMNTTMVMGRKTWDSLPKQPLPHRQHIILTRDKSWHFDHAQVSVIHDVHDIIQRNGAFMVIGGAEIFNIFYPFAHKIYLSQIHQDFPSDSFFSFDLTKDFKIISQQDFPDADYNFSHIIYTKTPKKS